MHQRLCAAVNVATAHEMLAMRPCSTCAAAQQSGILLHKAAQLLIMHMLLAFDRPIALPQSANTAATPLGIGTYAHSYVAQQQTVCGTAADSGRTVHRQDMI
jgi:hypothetical protein